jgi:hypothetical protein
MINKSLLSHMNYKMNNAKTKKLWFILLAGFLITSFVGAAESMASPGRPFDPSATKVFSNIEAIYYFTDPSIHGLEFPINAASTLREALESKFGKYSELQLIDARSDSRTNIDRFKRLYVKLSVTTVKIGHEGHPTGAFSLKLSRYYKSDYPNDVTNQKTLDHEITSGIEEPEFLKVVSFENKEHADQILNEALLEYFSQLQKTYENANRNREKVK